MCSAECIIYKNNTYNFTFIPLFPQIHKKVTENIDREFDKENEELYPKEKAAKNRKMPLASKRSRAEDSEIAAEIDRICQQKGDHDTEEPLLQR